MRLNGESYHNLGNNYYPCITDYPEVLVTNKMLFGYMPS